MFELLLWAVVAIALVGMLLAFDASRDVFHPLIFIMPMMMFLYAWMPLKLLGSGSLTQYFDSGQLVFVQTLNVFGVLAFVVGCLAAGSRRQVKSGAIEQLSELGCSRLRMGASIAGGLGLVCWLISIVNVGGFVNAFSKSYGGGWDDSGYIRDGTLLLLVGVLLMVGVIGFEGLKLINLTLICLFGLPWLTQAILMARRGPTFAILIIVCMGSFLMRNKRPPITAMVIGGLFLGWFSLFLVTNRSNIYLGSDSSLSTDVTDVTSIVEKPDTGNEYIYGTGSVVSTERRGSYFWMRRYLAQLLVRPIPSAIWPTKYQDFGVPELLSNAGTGEGFAEALGWVGAVGSAPGIIADLWIEVWWFAVPFMAVLGWAYGYVWNRAVRGGSAWKSQYVILAALSMYLVMQTMEAVIFRTVLLSVPCWLAWRWALRASPSGRTVPFPVEDGNLLEHGRLLGA